VSLAGAHKAGIKDADMTPDEGISGVGRGSAKSWTADFERVALGGEAVLHNRLEVADFDLHDADMLVGIDFFLSHRIYISKKRAHMFFTYNGGPVFALNHGDKAAPPDPAPSGPDPLTADEHARRGAASLARGDAAAALADLDRACTMEPGNAGFHLARAAAWLATPDGGTHALADLDTALRLDPSRTDARLERARGRFVNDQADEAKADLAVLDKSLPAQSQLRADMARLYGSMHMPTQVIAQWTLWITSHPHDNALESALNGRCWARTELGIELDKALQDCDNAIDGDSKNASYRDSRAWVYLRQGRLRDALSDFDRSLELNPTSVWSHYGRGLVHLRLGEANPAQTDLAAARAEQADIDDQVKKTGLPVAPDAPAAHAAARAAAASAAK
jgi:tetratricopeptide (TPR) repeat protein